MLFNKRAPDYNICWYIKCLKYDHILQKMMLLINSWVSQKFCNILVT